jgi:hypothetical protein
MRTAMNFSIFLDELFTITRTPPEESDSFLGNEEIQARISSLLCLGSRKRYSTLSDEQIASFIDFILRLVETPRSLIGLIRVEVPVKCLLHRTFTELALPWSEMKFWLCIVHDWFYVLRHSPDARKYLKRPHIKESFIFRFHIDAHQSSAYKGELFSSLYKAYAFPFHIALRFKQAQHADINTLNAYGLVAKDFFRCILPEYKSRKTHPDHINAEYFNAFKRGYNIAEYQNIDSKLTPTAIDKGLCLKRLINFNPIVPRPHGGHKGKRLPHPDLDPDTDILNIYLPDDPHGDMQDSPPVQRIDINFLSSTPIELQDEDPDIDIDSEIFEAPFQVPVFTVHQHDGTRKPFLKRTWMEIINLRNFKFAWSAQFLQLFHYAVIHYRLKMLWGKNDYWNAIIVFLYLLIHTGIDGSCLIALIVDSDNIAVKPSLRLNRGRRYIIIPSVIQTAICSSDICLHKSDEVWIPVPDLISALFDAILIHGSTHVFSYLDQTGVRKQLSLYDVDNFLETQINNSCIYQYCSISRAIICNSFLPLYCHRFGMDPLVATLVSGKDHHRLFKSQLHYTFIPHDKLEKEYLSAFNHVIEGIDATLNKVLEAGLIKSAQEDTLC